jgi:hypothetical protein
MADAPLKAASGVDLFDKTEAAPGLVNVDAHVHSAGMGPPNVTPHTFRFACPSCGKVNVLEVTADILIVAYIIGTKLLHIDSLSLLKPIITTCCGWKGMLTAGQFIAEPQAAPVVVSESSPPQEPSQV